MISFVPKSICDRKKEKLQLELELFIPNTMINISWSRFDVLSFRFPLIPSASQHSNGAGYIDVFLALVYSASAFCHSNSIRLPPCSSGKRSNRMLIMFCCPSTSICSHKQRNELARRMRNVFLSLRALFSFPLSYNIWTRNHHITGKTIDSNFDFHSHLLAAIPSSQRITETHSTAHSLTGLFVMLSGELSYCFSFAFA